jgi:hypothetical protein
VLLHMSLSDLCDWWPYAEWLANNGVHEMLSDLRCNGQSEVSTDPNKAARCQRPKPCCRPRVASSGSRLHCPGRPACCPHPNRWLQNDRTTAPARPSAAVQSRRTATARPGMTANHAPAGAGRPVRRSHRAMAGRSVPSVGELLDQRERRLRRGLSVLRHEVHGVECFRPAVVRALFTTSSGSPPRPPPRADLPRRHLH